MTNSKAFKHWIIELLQEHYSLATQDITQLSIGADLNTKVFCVNAFGNSYFLKLRTGEFSPASVEIPAFLGKHLIPNIISPIQTNSGQLWVNSDDNNIILYPFIDGKDAYQVKLSKENCQNFGRFMSTFHQTHFPEHLKQMIPKETFCNSYRKRLFHLLQSIKNDKAKNESEAQLLHIINTQFDVISTMIDHANSLAHQLSKEKNKNYIVCHGDLHAGNLLIRSNELFIVDWDTLVFAPKERDLMYIGGGLLNNSYPPAEETSLFYQGYGDVDINHQAVAYYRFERIIQDIVIYCVEIFNSSPTSDSVLYLKYLESNFKEGATIDQAFNAYHADPPNS